jgi:hypothetical protein
MAQILIAALVLAGWLMVYISSRRGVKRACADLRAEFQRQIDSLSETVRATERSAKAQEHGQGVEGAEEITPDTLAAIAKAITGLLGRKVRIRSVKMLQTPSTVASQWAQQGRVIVHASHNPAPRGREA